MRCVIFVAATVLLVIAAAIAKPEFGDIIYHEPTLACGWFKYRHVAVYVDEHQFKDKEPGETIFERLKSGSQCKFSKPDQTRNPVVCNFLDGYVDEKGVEYKKGTVAEMEARIKEKHGKCGLYEVISNNCEHLATYVRYGKQIAMQEGLTGEAKCISESGVTRQHMRKFIKAEKAAGRLKCDIPLTE